MQLKTLKKERRKKNFDERNNNKKKYSNLLALQNFELNFKTYIPVFFFQNASS